MTYFDPHIYNKQNLKKEDRAEIDYWECIIHNAIDVVAEEYCLEQPKALKKIISDIVEEFCEELKTHIGYELQENVVSIIDNYEDAEIKNISNPETYMYESEVDECKLE